MAKARKHNYLPGDVVNGAIFVRELPNVPHQERAAEFLCADCGISHIANICNAAHKQVIRCWDCHKINLSRVKTKHGEGGGKGKKQSKAYYTWNHIKQRCLNSNSLFYTRYGGRGIKMHKPWINDSMRCIAYLKSLPGYNDPLLPSIDRIDNDGNYEPGNLRWANYDTQAINKGLKSCNKTGFKGVAIHKLKVGNNFTAHISSTYIGAYSTAIQAAEARDWHIIKNGLWQYPLQVIRKTA